MKRSYTAEPLPWRIQVRIQIGSQFFIVHDRDVGLPPSYTIFGEVTGGMPVVDAIATAPVKSGGENSSPVEPARIESVDIAEG